MPLFYPPPITNSIDVSGRLVPSATGSAGANSTALQAALNAAAGTVNPTVTITVPGVYYIQQVVVPSNVNILIGEGVTLRKAPSYVASMFINEGALQGSPVGDSNIGFYGQGTIDGNASNQSGLTQATVSNPTVNTFLYGIQGEVAMINVTNFVYALQNAYNCNGFVVQYTGKNALFQNIICNTARDFIHINGPSSHIVIENCTGYSSDAFVALNAWDWHRSGPTVGDITDVRIRDCAYYGSNGLSVNGSPQNRTGGLVVLLPGTRSTGSGQGVGNVRNVSVDGFTIDMTQGSVTPASAGIQPSMAKDTLQGSEFAGVGLIENVWIGNGYCSVPNSNCAFLGLVSTNITADAQCTTTIRNLIIENVHCDASVGATGNNANFASTAFNTWNVENLKFIDCQWTPTNAAGTNQSFINWANKTPADSITVDGLTINSNTGTGANAAFLSNQYSAGNASTVSDLTLDRITTAPGFQITTAWFMVLGVVTNFRSRGNYLVGSGAGSDGQGIQFAATTAQIVSGVISDAYFNGTKEIVMVNTAAANAGTLSFKNCQFNNVTHPIFLNTGVALDVSFNGCAINTAGNLARLANAAGSLTLSFVDTTSSGAGASVITAAAAGTLRVRNTDRIQVPVGLTATNPPTPSNNDVVNFAGTPSYTGSVVISGTLAGLYVYRGTGTVGWVKLN